jgi:N-acetyl-gamma-glutamyl-phosphate reductase
MSEPIPVVIYGAGGYGGVGLVELLLAHPGVKISALVSREGAGAPYSDMYPHLRGKMDLVIENAETFDPRGRGSFVFFSTPDGVGQKLAQTYLDCGYKVIDFSGDFRFNAASTFKAYSAWQQGEMDHLCPDLLSEAVYGCAEWNREKIKSARLVGNPGCMAISCLLALMPATRENIIDMSRIVLDVKTGISGAGKKPKPLFHFPAADGNAYAYKIGKHQHLYEIELHLSQWSGQATIVNFTPHVIPLTRGIISTCVLGLKAGVSAQQVFEAYQKHYANEPFVSVEKGGLQELAHVRGSNQCRLGIHVVERSRSVVVTSLIDNLQKGQSGNAVQNMNLMLGFAETTGLDSAPRYP